MVSQFLLINPLLSTNILFFVLVVGSVFLEKTWTEMCG